MKQNKNSYIFFPHFEFFGPANFFLTLLDFCMISPIIFFDPQKLSFDFASVIYVTLKNLYILRLGLIEGRISFRNPNSALSQHLCPSIIPTLYNLWHDILSFIRAKIIIICASEQRNNTRLLFITCRAHISCFHVFSCKAASKNQLLSMLLCQIEKILPCSRVMLFI